jgi:AcrR family transcriptional regulator
VLYEDPNEAAHWNDAPMAETERSPNNAERGTSAPDGESVRRSSASGRKPTGAGRTAGERRGTSAEKRQLILETSIRVFAEKGYHDTRISDIAKRAEIAYGLVYHYFKNKEEILDTIFLERWGEFIAAVRVIAEGDRTVEDKLVAVAEVILSARQHDPEWVKILISEIQRSQRMLDRERLEIVAELFQLIARTLRDGQERGELRADLDAEIASTIFIGGIDTIVTSRVLEMFQTGDDGPPDEKVYFEHLSRTVVELFIRGMAAPDAFGARD